MTFKFLYRSLMLIIIFIIIYFSFRNISYSFLNYVASNLSIRETLTFENTIKNKGTHEGSIQYKKLIKNNINMFVSLDYKKTIEKYKLYKSFDLKNNNYISELNLMNRLDLLSKKKNNFKKNSIIYIPRSVNDFWDISCDTHMIPFIVPAISNIAMINGLPNLQKESCFGHKLEYGYYQYYKSGKKFNEEYLNDVNCEIINDTKYRNLIILKKITKSDYKFDLIKCNN